MVLFPLLVQVQRLQALDRRGDRASSPWTPRSPMTARSDSVLLLAKVSTALSGSPMTVGDVLQHAKATLRRRLR